MRDIMFIINLFHLPAGCCLMIIMILNKYTIQSLTLVEKYLSTLLAMISCSLSIGFFDRITKENILDLSFH